MRRWTAGAVYTVIFLDSAVLVTGLFLAFVPVDVLHFRQPQAQILNDGKSVLAGQAVVYEVQYCKQLDIPAVTTKALVGDVNYPLPVGRSNVPTGCHTAINRSTLIPVGVPSGTYHLELTFTYQVNPLRSQVVHYESEDFTILEPSNSLGAGQPLTDAPIADHYDTSSPQAGTANSSLEGSPTVAPSAPAVGPSIPAPQPSLVQRVLSTLSSL